jgi:hypothetical protein
MDVFLHDSSAGQIVALFIRACQFAPAGGPRGRIDFGAAMAYNFTFNNKEKP